MYVHMYVYECMHLCKWVHLPGRSFYIFWRETFSLNSKLGGLHAPAPTPSVLMPGCQLFAEMPGNLNSDSHAFMVGFSPTEPSSLPSLWQINWKVTILRPEYPVFRVATIFTSSRNKDDEGMKKYEFCLEQNSWEGRLMVSWLLKLRF